MERTRRAIGTLALTACLLPLAACGRSDDPEAKPTAATTSAAPSGAPATQEPRVLAPAPTAASARAFLTSLWTAVDEGRYAEACAQQIPEYAATDDEPCEKSMPEAAKDIHDNGYSFIPTKIEVEIDGNHATASIRFDFNEGDDLKLYLLFTGKKWLLSGDQETGDLARK